MNHIVRPVRVRQLDPLNERCIVRNRRTLLAAYRTVNSASPRLDSPVEGSGRRDRRVLLRQARRCS